VNRIRPSRARAPLPAGARNRKKTQIIFNNPRTSIKPESAPDPKSQYFIVDW